jgi:hypothetical protein
MKAVGWAALLVAALMLAPAPASAQCVTITSGQLLYRPGHYLAGQPMTPGVNPYGYNYQAHSFNGSYFNAYAGGDGLPPWDGDDAEYLAANPSAVTHWAWQYRFLDVAMKWNDAWLSNKDCGGDGLAGGPPDGLLDYHYGFATFVGSGAWLTNHNSWKVTLPNGKESRASEFVKFMAIPEDAIVAGPTHPYFMEGTVYLGNKVMGPQIWGEFAVIHWVLNDRSSGNKGLALKSQLASGFGFYRNY